MASFGNEKKQCLIKKDKSKKSSIDKPIRRLIDIINSLPDFYTTSSCSGRITLLEKKSDKKQETRWIFISHAKVSKKEIRSSIRAYERDNDVWLLFEPLIIHICAKDIASAERLLKASNLAGLKHSGIISAGKRTIIEIIGNEFMDSLIIKGGKVVVPEECLDVLVDESNQKLHRNDEKIRKFEDVVKHVLKPE